MAIKRKRSIPDFSPSPTPYSAESLSSSPNSCYTTDGDVAMGDWVSPTKVHPGVGVEHGRHLHSRTRKRFRDGRPDENTVHREYYVYKIVTTVLRRQYAEPWTQSREYIPKALLSATLSTRFRACTSSLHYPDLNSCAAATSIRA